MAEYNAVRCLFCEPRKEKDVVQLIETLELGRAIFPQRVKRFVQDKQWHDEAKPLLPGYVFLYTTRDDILPGNLKRLDHVVRLLSYGDWHFDTLYGRDLEFADWVWKQGGQIGAMKALEIGDRIEIVDGLFKELKGKITKMDRRRQSFQVELETEGILKNIWLTYNVIERIDRKKGNI